MRWKAGALLVGVAVLLTGLSSWISRRADERDDRHHSLEIAASVAAVRLDAAVNRAATTLVLAGDDVAVEQLADVIGAQVCRDGVRPGCALPGGSSADPAADPATDSIPVRAMERAADLAATVSRDEGGAGVAVVATDPPSTTATAIVVVVQHADRRMVAVLPLAPGQLVRSTQSPAGGDSVSAPLDTVFADGAWSAVATSDDASGPAAGLTLVTALQTVAGALITVAAIVAMTRDQRRLRRRATIDELTGLPNRAEFERRATRRLAQLGRDGTGACLIVVDLDGFKSINDSAGHAAGDLVLAEAGRRLAAAVRSTDLVGRWGGDEFVLLLAGVVDPLAIPDRTAAIAACLRDLPTDPGLRLTASVGAAAFPLEGRDLATLLGLADRAMYEMKPRAGGGDDTRSGFEGTPAVPWRP